MATSGSPLSHTHVVQFHSPTSRLPDWLDSKDSLWLQFGYLNYQHDHRSNTISNLLLEFSKVGMRAHVFWIPREVHFIFLRTYIKLFILNISKLVESFFAMRRKSVITLLTLMVFRERQSLFKSQLSHLQSSSFFI